MKKQLAILAVLALVSTNAFAFAKKPDFEPRPAVVNKGTCFAAVDWDGRNTTSLTYPYGMKKMYGPEYEVALAAWYDYTLPRNLVCIDKYSK